MTVSIDIRNSAGNVTVIYVELYSKGFEPGSDSRSCSVIVRVRVVLKRTVVGDSD